MTGQEYAAALRQVADWYDAHPDAPFTTSLGVGAVHETREAVEVLARALAPCNKEHHSEFFILSRMFDEIELRFIFYRATVCERIVVGTEEIAERLIPAETREKIEWRCAPIFEATE